MVEKPPYHDDWKKEAPLLAGLSEIKEKLKQGSYSVPDNYFDQLPGLILERAKNQPVNDNLRPSGLETKPPTLSAPPDNLLRFWSLAAVIAVLLVFGLSFHLMVNFREPIGDFSSLRIEHENKIASLTPEELFAGLNPDEMDDRMLAEVMGEEALSTFSEVLQVPDQAVNDFLETELNLDIQEITDPEMTNPDNNFSPQLPNESITVKGLEGLDQLNNEELQELLEMDF